MTSSRSQSLLAARLPVGLALLCASGLLAAQTVAAADSSNVEATLIADQSKGVFYDGTLDEALAEVEDTDRVLVLYFTAVWCGPCQQMQRTTWVDERVVEKFTTDGLVVKIDVDDQEDLAQRYRVRAMPTMFAMRDGKEVDRIVGMKTAEQMLEWFGKVQALEPGEVVELEPVAEDDVEGRYERAKQLQMIGQLDDALREYLWLWDNIPTKRPQMMAVRTSFMTGDIKRLCREHKPAHAAFSKKRDEALLKMEQTEWNHWDVLGFVALNEALGETAATLRWYDSIKNDEAGKRMIDIAGSRLVRLLIDQQRYPEAGRLMRDPVQSAQRTLRDIVSSTELLAERAGNDSEIVGIILRDTAERHAREVTALFAAERDGEATRVAAIVVKELGVLGRQVLAEVAVKAGYARPLHLRLLESIPEETRPDGYGELVGKVREAIATQQG